MSEKTYQLYKAKVPEPIFTKFKMLSVKHRKEIPLRDLVTAAIERHVKAVNKGDAKPVADELDQYPKDTWVAWTLSVEKDVYKNARIIMVDRELDMFDFVATAMLRYLESPVKTLLA